MPSIVRNESDLDRGIRLFAGLIILVLGAAMSSWWGLIGLIPLGTALVGFCPLYRVFNVTTCPAK